MADGMIDDHLAELAATLTLPRRLRRRALLEARDHLHCAAERHREAGLGAAEAEAAAVRDHGSPALIAHRYAEQLAHGAAQLQTVVGLAAVLAYAVLCAVATQISPARASDPAEAIGWFAVQIALTCAALSTVRSLRHRADVAIPAGKLRLINRGWAVSIGAVLISVGANLLGGYGGGASSAWRDGLLVATVTTAIAAVLALAGVLLSARRTRELARHADEPARDDALDDLRAVALLAAGRLLPAGRLERAELAASRLASARAVRAIALRAHPWRFCLVVAIAAGASAAAANLVGEGTATDGIALTLAAGGVLIVTEALAIVACFALLGSFLGIRGGYRPARSA